MKRGFLNKTDCIINYIHFVEAMPKNFVPTQTQSFIRACGESIPALQTPQHHKSEGKWISTGNFPPHFIWSAILMPQPLYYKNARKCVNRMYFNSYYKLVGHHKDNVLRNFDLQSSQQLSKGKGYLSDMVRLELLLMITEFKLSCYLSAKILNLPYTNSKVIYRVFKQENRIRSHSRGSKKPPAINDKHLQNTCKTLR